MANEEKNSTHKRRAVVLVRISRDGTTAVTQNRKRRLKAVRARRDPSASAGKELETAGSPGRDSAAPPVMETRFSDVRLAQQMGSHARVIRANAEIPIAKLPENRSRAQMPARPGERRISIQILSVHVGACIHQALN